MFNCGYEIKSIPIDLHSAANIGDVDFFQQFQNLTVQKVNEYNEEGWTPLMYAALRGSSAFAEELIKRGAVTYCTNCFKVTPLMLAVSSGDQHILHIITKPEELNFIDNRGWSALFYAVFYGRIPAVLFLVKKGANLNLKDNEGITPLILAVKKGIESIVDILITSGADLNARTPKKETALILAKKSGNIEMEKLISQHTPKSTPMKMQFLKLGRELRFSPNQKNVDLQQQKCNPCRILVDSPSPNCDRASPQVFKKQGLDKPGNAIVCDPVLTFLKQLALDKYWPLFRDEEVDFETLLTFEDQNLQEIGLRLYGPRRKLLLAIQDYKKRDVGNKSAHQIKVFV